MPGLDESLSDAEAKQLAQKARDSGQYITNLSPDQLSQLTREVKDALFRRLATSRLRE